MSKKYVFAQFLMGSFTFWQKLAFSPTSFYRESINIGPLL